MCETMTVSLLRHNSNYGFSDAKLDWIEQGLTSHSTHFRSFWRWWGDCSISHDCSRSQWR